MLDKLANLELSLSQLEGPTVVMDQNLYGSGDPPRERSDLIPQHNTTRYREKPEVFVADDAITTIDCGPCCRKMGVDSWPYCRNLWLVKDICGIVCAFFTWSLVLYSNFVVTSVVLFPSPHTTYKMINLIIHFTLAFLSVASHVKAMTTDPGTIPKGNATKENIMKLGLRQGQVVFRCPKCACIKPERAHHCSVCKRCVKKMDHHCPWVNNCVGESNQKYFVLFTLYICFVSIHALYLAVQHFVTCVGSDWKECTGYSPPAATVFLIFLIFEGLLFGIFTAVMFGTQIHAICTDETQIESLKGEDATWERKSSWMNMKAIFGHPFSLQWFNPFHVPNTSSGKAKPYLYMV